MDILFLLAPCCLLVGCKAKGKVNCFNDSTLKYCKEISNHRKNYLLKYMEIVIPSEIDNVHGFHIECYRKYVGLSEKHRKLFTEDKESTPNTPEQNILLRSSSCSTSSPTCSSAGVFDSVCFICGKKERKVSGERQELKFSTHDLENPILDIVIELNDQELIKRLEVDKAEHKICDFVAKELKYHGICRTELQRRAEIKVKKNTFITNSSWHETRKVHASAFEKIKKFVDSHVIVNSEAHFLKSLVEDYRALLVEIGGHSFDETVFTSQHLQDKLTLVFGQKIKFDHGNKRRGNIIYNANTDLDTAVRKAFERDQEWKQKVREVALFLRKCIVNAKKKCLPDKLTLTDLFSGEVQTPEELQEFLETLVIGLDSRRENSRIKKRRITSLAHNMIYSATGGKVKPSTQIIYGLALKSMTGSKRILEVSNRLGHTLSYNGIEELETELTYSSIVDQRLTPYGIAIDSSLSTGVAFDNFDLYVETLSGKDTLHDTVGIIYQDIRDEIDFSTSEPIPTENETNTSLGKRKRRSRTFDVEEKNLEPYYKKPKIRSLSLLPINDQKRNVIPECSRTCHLLDTLWKISSYFIPSSTPMWVGWNAAITEENDIKQQVCYLPQIDMSPTSNTVVVETLKMAQQVAEEMGKNEICVTYDLAIAKMAMQIQAEESPRFDNVFVFMGQFHTEMAFFNTLGKFIAESGGPSILVGSQVIASGSLKGLITGKHYNRCKRIHPLFATAMELLHFKLFLSSRDDIVEREDLIKKELSELMNKDSAIHRADFSSVSLSKELMTLIDDYNKFKENTRKGLNGLTAQYWMIYVELVDLYHNFSRSTRSGNIELYVHSLELVTDLFFCFNLPNYSRWSVRLHDNLLKIEETHPSLAREFKCGRFGVKRTSKNFSRMPIDLTLEQTINADAASQRTGILSITNSVSARKRWAQSHFLRISVVSHLLDNLDLNKKEDVTSDLKPCKMKKNAEALKNLHEQIEECINPFDRNLEKSILVNIDTGKGANPETAEFLMNVREIGKSKRESFIKEVNERPPRFEEPITRLKLKTFANEGVKTKTRNDKKVSEIKMERNLYGRLLCIALEKSIDLSFILTYPITPVPLSMCHIDGTMASTRKDKLVHPLEKRICSLPPEHVDCYILDGMFFLRTMKYFPSTYGRLSEIVLRKVCTLNSHRIDLVFDSYVYPSIKDLERNQRGADRSTNYQILSCGQECPKDMPTAFKSLSFKKALIEFFMTDWSNNRHSDTVGFKKVYTTSQQRCVSYENVDGEYVTNIEYHLTSTQEEADYRILTHLHDIPANSFIVVRANDTDIFIILIGNQYKLTDKHIWMEIGTMSNNSLRFIDITKLAENLGIQLSQSLPAFHAFTGCDFSPSFVGKGKARPLNLLLKYPDCQRAFSQLGTAERDDDVLKGIESFACKMYGDKSGSSINDVLTHNFFKSFKSKRNADMLSAVKGCDGSSLPPCSRILFNHILRTEYIASMWKNNKDLPCPSSYGWTLTENMYNINWFDGDQYPPDVNAEGCTSDYDENDDELEKYESDEDESSDDEDEDIADNWFQFF